MKSTLLGLAIAAVVTALGALAAAFLIDWGAQRALFESRLATAFGARVTIAGPIDAQLLPTPRFVLREVAIGGEGRRLDAAEAFGSLELWPLLRGEIQARELVLVEPRIEIDTEALGSPGLAIPIAARRLVVEGGAVAIRDRAAGRTLAIDDLDVTGDLRGTEALARLQGRATVAGVGATLRLIASAAPDGVRLRFAADDLRLDGPRGRLTGRLAWDSAGAPGGLLTAELDATSLDLDAQPALADAAGFLRALARGGEARLNFGADALRYADATARRVEARLVYGAATLAIERLGVADFGGLTATAQGRLERLDGEVDGRIRLDLAADGTAGLEALAAAAGLPQAFARRLVPALVPARLTADIVAGNLLVEGDISPEEAARTLALGLRGSTGLGAVNMRAGVPLDAPETVVAAVTLSGGSARTWASLAGLDLPAGDARLGLNWNGQSGGAGEVEARLSLPAFEADARGRLALRDGRLDPDLGLAIAKGDLAKLLPAQADSPLPVFGSLWLTRAGDTLRAEAIDLQLAGTPVKGALEIGAGDPLPLAGALAAGRIDLPQLLAVLGRDTLPVALDLTLSTPQLILPLGWTVADAKGTLTHAAPRSELIVNEGRFAGGQARGRLAMATAEDGVSADLAVSLSGADLALLPAQEGGAKPAGRLDAEIEAAGTARTPADLPAAFTGHGTLKVAALSWPGLSPNALAVLAGLAGKTAPSESAVRAAAEAALAAGPLDLPRVAATLALAGGQVRIGDVQAETAEATLRGSAELDLGARKLQARLDISPRATALPGSPELAVRWAGPFLAPRREIDVSAVMAALARAAAERAPSVSRRGNR
ncbi:AsmA-like C-terminal region-containing protein [Blastochloris tepida]|uniref:Uncharacterized protein n=1 Tax=Blastochloris tepida TaxID=2233851 RepID=A0A348FVP1_9HYPH|nr:AsmA-like C-terminal region-containing protein [Blastochloris tepida]BBF91374.1 hypothetical protein BLTE_00590 [Blastochloris tepida]